MRSEAVLSSGANRPSPDCGFAPNTAGSRSAASDVSAAELPPRDSAMVSEHHGKGPWGSEAEPDRVQAHFELDSKHAAHAFADELGAEGYDVHQAGSYVFIFADDGAAARELGNALKERARVGAQLFSRGRRPNALYLEPWAHSRCVRWSADAYPKLRGALLVRHGGHRVCTGRLAHCGGSRGFVADDARLGLRADQGPSDPTSPIGAICAVSPRRPGAVDARGREHVDGSDNVALATST